jgi:ABC-type branched-subunit amino acid transport system ATPase component
MLHIDNVYKSFGKQHVLQGVTMLINSGEIHTLIGGNGSGKTTLFNLITGFIKPNQGEISLNQKSLHHESPVAINQKGITRTFQDLRIIKQLSVKDNILLSFKNNPGEKLSNAFLPSRIFQKQYQELDDKANIILEKIHLTSVAQNLAGEISYGQQKLLTIGCCIANDAKLLLLDEPIAGIDKENYVRIYQLLLDLKKKGKTILQIEHNHEFVKSLSDGIWFLHDGKVRFFKNYDEFTQDEMV